MFDIPERLIEFAATIIMLSEKLNKSYTHRHITMQLIRSSTSAGANFQESRSAESHADFIHKLQIVLKELRESLYWLQLMKKTHLLSEEQSNLLVKENTELIKIIAASVITAKRNTIK